MSCLIRTREQETLKWKGSFVNKTRARARGTRYTRFESHVCINRFVLCTLNCRWPRVVFANDGVRRLFLLKNNAAPTLMTFYRRWSSTRAVSIIALNFSAKYVWQEESSAPALACLLGRLNFFERRFSWWLSWGLLAVHFHRGIVYGGLNNIRVLIIYELGWFLYPRMVDHKKKRYLKILA